jgi:hypothetical protein
MELLSLQRDQEISHPLSARQKYNWKFAAYNPEDLPEYNQADTLIFDFLPP